MVWQKAKTGKSPGYHSHTEKDLKHAGWCLNKNIKIAVIPNGSDWQVEININKSIHLDSNFERGRSPGLKGLRLAIIPRALAQLQLQM